MWHTNVFLTLRFAMMVLTDTAQHIDIDGYIASLPSPEHTTMHCTNLIGSGSASARVMLGETLEHLGRHADAIKCAHADLQVWVCGCGCDVGGWVGVCAKLDRSLASLCLLR